MVVSNLHYEVTLLAYEREIERDLWEARLKREKEGTLTVGR